MESNKRKWIFIGCGAVGVLFLLCCILMIVFFTVYSERITEKILDLTGNWAEEALLENLPEGVNEKEARNLVRTIWDDMMNKMITEKVSPNEASQFINNDLRQALADKNITPDEFDLLVDRFHEVFYDSAKDEDQLDELKQHYRQSKQNGQMSAEEINEMMFRINEILAPSEINSSTKEQE